MSIASEITRLQNAKSSIKTSIENKGVSVPSNAKLDDYSDFIDDIQTGGDNPLQVNTQSYIPTSSENGMFAVDINTNNMYRIEEATGRTWNEIRVTTTLNMNSMCYGNGTFVCVGDYGYSRYSINGIDWYTMSGLGTTYMYSVCYGNGIFVCAGADGKVYVSNNGQSWTNMYYAGSTKLKSICYGNGIFVCVGAAGKSYYSTDGTTWTAMTGLNTSRSYTSVCYGNGRFVCIGEQDAYYSINGTSWTAMTGYTNAYLQCVCYGNGKFVAVGQNRFYISTGTDWNSNIISGELFGIYFNGEIFCVVGYSGISYYSTDGITWTAMSGLSNSRNYYSIAYGNGKFACCGSLGYGYTLPIGNYYFRQLQY